MPLRDDLFKPGKSFGLGFTFNPPAPGRTPLSGRPHFTYPTGANAPSWMQEGTGQGFSIGWESRPPAPGRTPFSGRPLLMYPQQRKQIPAVQRGPVQPAGTKLPLARGSSPGAYVGLMPRRDMPSYDELMQQLPVRAMGQNRQQPLRRGPVAEQGAAQGSRIMLQSAEPPRFVQPDPEVPVGMAAGLSPALGQEPLQGQEEVSREPATGSPGGMGLRRATDRGLGLVRSPYQDLPFPTHTTALPQSDGRIESLAAGTLPPQTVPIPGEVRTGPQRGRVMPMTPAGGAFVSDEDRAAYFAEQDTAIDPLRLEKARNYAEQRGAALRGQTIVGAEKGTGALPHVQRLAVQIMQDNPDLTDAELEVMLRAELGPTPEARRYGSFGRVKRLAGREQRAEEARLKRMRSPAGQAALMRGGLTPRQAQAAAGNEMAQLALDLGEEGAAGLRMEQERQRGAAAAAQAGLQAAKFAAEQQTRQEQIKAESAQKIANARTEAEAAKARQEQETLEKMSKMTSLPKMLSAANAIENAELRQTALRYVYGLMGSMGLGGIAPPAEVPSRVPTPPATGQVPTPTATGQAPGLPKKYDVGFRGEFF